MEGGICKELCSACCNSGVKVWTTVWKNCSFDWICLMMFVILYPSGFDGSIASLKNASAIILTILGIFELFGPETNVNKMLGLFWKYQKQFFVKL